MQQPSGQTAFRLSAPRGITGTMTPSSNLPFRAFCLLAALLLAGIAFWLARGSLTFEPELRAWDTLFRVRGRLPVRSDFVLVAGDTKSIQALGQPPWPRRVYADVVRAVHRAGPKAIILDRFFEERDTSHPGSDAALWKAVADARDVFLPVVHGDPGGRQITRDDLRGLVALEKSTVTLEFTRLNTTPDYAWLGFDPPVSDFALSARGMGVSTVSETADADGVIRRTRVGWISPIEYPAQPPLPEPSSLSGRTGVVPGLPVIAAMFAFNVDKTALAYTFGEHLLIGGSLKPPVFIPIDAMGHIDHELRRSRGHESSPLPGGCGSGKGRGFGVQGQGGGDRTDRWPDAGGRAAPDARGADAAGGDHRERDPFGPGAQLPAPGDGALAAGLPDGVRVGARVLRAQCFGAASIWWSRCSCCWCTWRWQC